MGDGRLPRIGLISDSHGRTAHTRLAVQALHQAGAQMLLHLGDVGGAAVIDEMLVACADSTSPSAATLPVQLVFGNTDHDIADLTRHASALGLAVQHPVGRLPLPEQRTLVFMHGDDPAAIRQALNQGVTYLCMGHTHQRSDHRIGATRLINPGALARTPLCTVALLDTDTDYVRFLTLDGRA